jgi:hypothetical protein
MRHVRASSGRRAAAVAADVTAVADTAGVGGVTVVASEEAATSQPALPAVRCLSGFALAADLISALRTAHATAALGKYGQGWIRTSEGVKPADLQSAPFGQFGTYPFGARDFIYPRASQLATRVSFCSC